MVLLLTKANSAVGGQVLGALDLTLAERRLVSGKRSLAQSSCRN